MSLQPMQSWTKIIPPVCPATGCRLRKLSPANLFPEGIDPSSICLDCHHYSDNHHPVNFVPQGTFKNSEGEDFPLFDGEMRCLTCHRVHQDQGLVGRPRLLRGGPYSGRTEICFSCHDKDLNSKDRRASHDRLPG